MADTILAREAAPKGAFREMYLNRSSTLGKLNDINLFIVYMTVIWLIFAYIGLYHSLNYVIIPIVRGGGVAEYIRRWSKNPRGNDSTPGVCPGFFT